MPCWRFPALFLLGAVAFAQAPPTTSSNPSRPSNPEATKERSGYDPLLDAPPLPANKVTLIGGIVDKLDPVRDRMAVRVFGGRDLAIAYDMRTKIYRDAAPASMRDLKPGMRVYVDTMLNGDQVFAKTINIKTKAAEGDTRGQVISYDPKRGVLRVREQLTPQPFELRVTPQTSVEIHGGNAAVSEIHPGAIVVIHFQPGLEHQVARHIQVLANPGESFTFYGRITFLDLRASRIAIANQSDGETYDIALNSIPPAGTRSLRTGADAKVSAVFDGKQYEAKTLEVMSQAAKQASEPEQ